MSYDKKITLSFLIVCLFVANSVHLFSQTNKYNSNGLNCSKLVDTNQLSSPISTHVSLGSGILSVNGTTLSLSGLSAAVSYKATDRLNLRFSLSSINSVSLSHGNYNITGNAPRDLAPRRQHVSAAASANLAFAYQVNDRLWVAASLQHWGGELAFPLGTSPWFFGTDSPQQLDATALSAALKYKFGNDDYLMFHFSILEDRTGAIGPLCWGDPFWNRGHYSFSSFGNFMPFVDF